jgi:hypothetical protein
MRPFYPFVGNINMYEAAGDSFSKNITFRIFPAPTLRLFGVGIGGQAQYTLGWADDNASPAVNQYDWRPEWSRSNFDSRHRFQGFLNLTMPHSSILTFNVSANSGRPYSITTGNDDNGDGNANDRPIGVARNSLIGPGAYNVNMNFSKTFPLRKVENGGAGAPQVVVNGPPPPPGAVILPGPGGPIGGAPGQGPRLIFTANITNLLNHTQLRSYSGIITSPLFGKAVTAGPGRTMNLGLNLAW